MDEDAALTADEILTFGPVVEAVTWTPVWLQETRAPIAVAAGRPKFGPVFNDDGIGKAVIIRPCMSRGRRIKGLPPIYTPKMLEGAASVFDGWPMFTDHVPAELAAALAKRGRSVRELAGQVLKGRWQRDFVQESDHEFGYQKGGVLAEVWGAPVIRKTVDNNPNLLHTSISAWPTSGRPGPCPWRAGVKGMIIEGIRRQPQGSVDYVVRGGAGGKLLLEGVEDEPAWPEVGEWSEEDTRLVVSIAERLYASPAMAEITLPSKPSELKDWLAEHAPHLVPALEAANDDDADDTQRAKKRGRDNKSEPPVAEHLTVDDVRRLIQEANAGTPTVEEFEERLRENTRTTIAEREQQRELSRVACDLIESAEGILPSWKKDLKARYQMVPSGPPTTLQIQESDLQDADGNALSEQQVVEARVARDLDHVRGLIAEAQGKPRVKGEGGGKRDPHESGSRRSSASTSHWRREFVSMGLAESEDKALEVFGGKVES